MTPVSFLTLSFILYTVCALNHESIQTHQIQHIAQVAMKHGTRFVSSQEPCHPFHPTHSLSVKIENNLTDLVEEAPSNPTWIIHVKVPVTGQMRTKLEKTIKPYQLGSYIPHGAFLFTGNISVATKLLRLSEVMDVSIYHSQLKLHPQFKDILKTKSTKNLALYPKLDTGVDLPENNTSSITKTDKISLTLRLSKDIERSIENTREFVHSLPTLLSPFLKAVDSSNCISEIGADMLTQYSAVVHLKVSDKNNCQNFEKENLSKIAFNLAEQLTNLPQVTWVEPKRSFKTLNRYVAKLVQSGSNVSSIWDKNLHGEGQIISIGDTGIDYDMCFFSDPDRPVPLNKVDHDHRKIVTYTDISESQRSIGDEFEGHGTHVAATALGEVQHSDNLLIQEMEPYKGVAYKAKVAFYDLGTNEDISTPYDLGSGYFEKAYAVGARISSNSWGSDGMSYSVECLQTDEFVWEHKDFLIAYAAGNDGEYGHYSLSVPSNAKNSIAVGASKSTKESFFEAGFTAGVEIISTDVSKGFLVGTASFGPIFHQILPFEANVVRASPILGCSPLTNSDQMQGKIVLMVRGSCFFEEKALAAQSAGAIMLVIINNDDSGVIAMGKHSQTKISIPTVSLKKSDGESVLDLLSNGETVKMKAPYIIDDESYRSGLMAEFSSLGPTLDGRIKPDIVAPGMYVFSAKSDGNLHTNQCKGKDSIFTLSGTSMATPVVAGAAALVRQYFTEGWYPTGEKLSKNSIEPSAALVKAVLIHSGSPLEGFVGSLPVSGPISVFQGYGQITLQNVLIFKDSNVQSVVWISDDQHLSTLEVYKQCFKVSKSGRLRASLVWTDPPGEVNSVFALVNNLDLSVVNIQDLSVFLGNGLYTSDSAGSNHVQWDNLNNVEQVRIDSAPQGYYLVQVHGTNAPHSPQPFALVVSGEGLENVAMTHCAESACPNSCSGNGDCSEIGVCNCKRGFTGADCSQYSNAIELSNSKSFNLKSGGWEFYHFQVTESMRQDFSKPVLRLSIDRLTSYGDPDLYVQFEEFPSLSNYLDALLEPGDSQVTHLDYYVSELQTGTYRVGVYAFCCEDVTVRLRVEQGLFS